MWKIYSKLKFALIVNMVNVTFAHRMSNPTFRAVFDLMRLGLMLQEDFNVLLLHAQLLFHFIIRFPEKCSHILHISTVTRLCLYLTQTYELFYIVWQIYFHIDSYIRWQESIRRNCQARNSAGTLQFAKQLSTAIETETRTVR